MNDLMKWLKENDPSTIMLFILLFLATLAPGMLLIFLYDRDLFLKLDFLKLSMLSLSFTIPALLTKMSLVYFSFPSVREETPNLVWKVNLFFSSALNLFSFYTGILYSFFTNTSLKGFIEVYVRVEFVLGIGLLSSGIITLAERFIKRKINYPKVVSILAFAVQVFLIFLLFQAMDYFNLPDLLFKSLKNL